MPYMPGTAHRDKDDPPSKSLTLRSSSRSIFRRGVETSGRSNASRPKPRIAITLGSEPKLPSDHEYRDAVLNAGGEAVLLRPGDSIEGASQFFDGLLLSGGEDVDPEFYREKKEPFCDAVDRERDEFEIALLKGFLSEKKPVLAICRGIQLLNVAAGGTLYQDMEKQLGHGLHAPHKSHDHLSREEKRAFRHPVKIEAGSILHLLFGNEKDVNSRHHQAVKTAAPLLKVTAVSRDGIIEGVESESHPWVVGVQWHPESYEVYPAFIPLFEGFVSACSERLPDASTPDGTKSRTYVGPPDRTGAEASS